MLNTVEAPRHTLAIVGGGLSGLATAFYFLRGLSPAVKAMTRVVIYEKQNRTGGWCQSIVVPRESPARDLPHNSAATTGDAVTELVFETGPRSIRPVGLPGWLTVELVSFIGCPL